MCISKSSMVSPIRPARGQKIIFIRLRIIYTRLTHNHFIISLSVLSRPHFNEDCLINTDHFYTCPSFTNSHYLLNIPYNMALALQNDSSINTNVFLNLQATGFRHPM